MFGPQSVERAEWITSLAKFEQRTMHLAPADVGLRVRERRNWTRHRRASWMVWDRVWRGAHKRVMKRGGSRATPARTIQPENECTLPIPAMGTAVTQTVAMMVLTDTSCMRQL